VFLQPVLAGRYLPGIHPKRAKTLHQWVGSILVIAVILHVAGLWITSPPDMIDALLLRSPTPFSAWGVIAMWALFLTATLAILKHRRAVPPAIWRNLHTGLAIVIATSSAVHALLIEGTMEPITKTLLCACAVIATLKVITDIRARRIR